MSAELSPRLPWGEIEKNLVSLTEVKGGFTMARRGIVALSDGTEVFVKVGVDEITKEWARKEVEVYRFLKRHHFPFIPELLAFNGAETSFALEPLKPEGGWDWTDTWTKERLDKTLEAMDQLATLQPSDADKRYFGGKGISEAQDGWRPLVESDDMRQVLLMKLRSAGYQEIADSLDFTAMASRSAMFTFERSHLVHNDVRADNCAWNAGLQTVRLVDWNWAQMGDRRIDLNAMLMHVHNAGVDVTVHCPERLNTDALHWLAGFWLKSSTMPMWPGAPEHMDLRDRQFRAGVTALMLV